ncbi:hypothetical protein BDV33DRAFT_9559 [Aspergillus novoparasiticus]|uniref:Uncharacterized protein n=1 Tax=Aspergillus novoparasiticus TaxID=986946 RepID=A0A5N6EFW0_9EURO|nr:hypothetical protein BDV33DRAFT_9559 [Aspergillus novoparasiticus]
MLADTQPNTPAGWQAYASLREVTEIPATADASRDESGRTEIHRNIYLEGAAILQKPLLDCEIYTDVLTFNGGGEVILSPDEDTTMEINARVLTADQPVHLNMTKAGARSSALMIYAAVVDQPISVSVEGTQRTTLDLGPDSGHVGAEIDFTDGHLGVSYTARHEYDATEIYQAFLATELRVALALFWSQPAIAISICSYVAQSTYNIQAHSLSNAQAVSLGQQLAAHAMAGPRAKYAPTLPFQRYHDTMKDQLEAAKTFEDQYQRFQDKDAEVTDKIAAWTAMLQNAQDQRATRLSVQSQTLAKYRDARSTADACVKQLSDDDDELQDAKDVFDQGLVDWEKGQILKAAFAILSAIFEFAFGIAELCIGNDPGGAAKGVEDAVESVEKVEEGAAEAGQIMTSSTLQKLSTFTAALQKLYPKVDALVAAANKLAALPGGDEVDLPSLNDISGSGGSDADSSLITSLAAWDDWELECDQQMEWAADQEKIGGASQFRLALRKHAVHGRALAQAQAEAIKQGQQYVQTTLEVLQLDQDIQNLQTLLDTYHGEEAIYAAGQAQFYDRFLQLKTSLAIQLQYIIDAYRFYALQDSQVRLESQQSVGDFQQNLSTLQTEMQNVDNQYAEDFTPFDYYVYSDELPSNFPQLVIDGLKDNSQGHKATFTLVATPQASSQAGEHNFAYPFTNGSHYRLDGLEIQLMDVKPRPEAVHDGRAVVSLKIETSGSYSDIQHDQVFYFVSPMQQKRYSYEIGPDGSFLRIRDKAIFEPTNHAEPPPFTQWTITLETPENVDMSTLNKIQLHWNGKYRPY